MIEIASKMNSLQVHGNCSVLLCSVLFCSVLFCSVLFCSVLFCSVLLKLRSVKTWSNEPPWMTPELSSLIKKRQIALKQGNTVQFKYLRNRVNRKRKSCRAKYYAKSVQHLKQCKPSAWWDEVKKLSGSKSVYKNN